MKKNTIYYFPEVYSLFKQKDLSLVKGQNQSLFITNTMTQFLETQNSRYKYLLDSFQRQGEYLREFSFNWKGQKRINHSVLNLLKSTGVVL
ncbi:hypothetical protein ACQKMZ_28965 [Bacillus paramycoides]|uniref:hypothetical protein n=1 Tax=Bacillus paramycoides TaxID=2026194 RepID=UPI003CFBE7BE